MVTLISSVFFFQVQWEKDMINDDAVKESYLSPLIHAEYRQMRRDGRDLDYDFMHKKN